MEYSYCRTGIDEGVKPVAKTANRNANRTLPAQNQLRLSPELTAYAVTFFILYIRFMFMPINAYSMFLQVVIIIILLVLPSDQEYFMRKFVVSRIAVLLVLAFFVDQDDESK